MKNDKIESLSKCILTAKELLDGTNYANDRPIYEMYLTSLSIIIAKSINGISCKKEIEAFERLIGNTWLHNTEDHNRFYKSWEIAKKRLL